MSELNLLCKVLITVVLMKVLYEVKKCYDSNDAYQLLISFQPEIQSQFQSMKTKERSITLKYKLAKQFECDFTKIKKKWMTMLSNISMICGNDTSCNNMTSTTINVTKHKSSTIFNERKNKGFEDIEKKATPVKDKEYKFNNNMGNDTKNNHLNDNRNKSNISVSNAHSINENVSNSTSRRESQNNNATELCPDLPQSLGPLSEFRLNKRRYVKIMKQVQFGGIHYPDLCKPRHSVSLIIPYVYKDITRAPLVSFMYVMHPFLIVQQIAYRIYVVKQSGQSNQTLSPGALMNIGFKVSRKLDNNRTECFIFHSAQLLPTDSRNVYRCSWYPRQLATVADVSDFGGNRPKKLRKTIIDKLSSKTITGTISSEVNRQIKLNKSRLIKFGGALSINSKLFTAVNGFPNALLKKDGEFDIFYQRVKIQRYAIERSPSLIARYLEQQTGFDVRPYSIRRNLDLQSNLKSWKVDGLSSLSFKVVSIEKKPMYTLILVDDPDVPNHDNFVDALKEMLSTIDPPTERCHKY